MRIRIIQAPTAGSIDGIRLDRFEVGQSYEVGTSLGSVLLAEGWAVPAPTDDPEPALPMIDTARRRLPPNLIVETRRASTGDQSQAADRPRRKRRPR